MVREPVLRRIIQNARKIARDKLCQSFNGHVEPRVRGTGARFRSRCNRWLVPQRTPTVGLTMNSMDRATLLDASLPTWRIGLHCLIEGMALATVHHQSVPASHVAPDGILIGDEL